MSFFKNRKFGKSKKTESVEPDSSSTTSSSSASTSAPPNALHAQYPTPSSVATKIRLSILATAMVDALGGPVEFHERFTFPFVTTMQPNGNFNLPAGVWTDDTSMMLCLARSLATFKPAPGAPHTGGFSEAHQLALYARWQADGYLSAVGRCFDIGGTTSRALAIYSRHRAAPADALALIRSELAEEKNCGNGSLMRVLPIALAYWRDADEAKIYAHRSSAATHPAPLALEACQLWTALLTLVVEKATERRALPAGWEEPPFAKLDLLDALARYPYEHHALLVALALPPGLPPRPEGVVEREAYYAKYHPLLRLVAATQTPPAPKDSKFPYYVPPVESVPSTGYVLHTLVAALYCFFATKTFEEGALMAVNLGNDADTVGTVYAGLAGVWYAGLEGEAEGVFWTKRVREWRKALVNPHIIEEVAEELVGWEQKLAD